ncbi:MAG: SDR family NAD(P)-dependent oxidoreductase, partial [Acidimicrobiia bacterium]
MDLSEYRALFDLTGKTAVVIGAGSGIGRAGAEALAAHGADVVCGDLSGDTAASVADGINAQGGSARSAVVDLGDGSSIESLYDSVDRLDIMVTTPAINVRKRLLDVTEEEFERVVALNLV